jgi:hypothetical protein
VRRVSSKTKKGAIDQMKNKVSPIYQFKVTLLNINPPVWRRIQVRGDISLHRFSTVILIAMGWDGGHLHQFHIAGKFYGIPDDDFESYHETTDERKVKIQDLSRNDLKAFTFEYDFGDGWEHAVKLEKVLESEQGIRRPRCIEGARNCPPDDCGGPFGYIDFLKAMKNQKHPEHKSMTEWIGGEFDPESFDPDIVNGDLKDAAGTEKA